VHTRPDWPDQEVDRGSDDREPAWRDPQLQVPTALVVLTLLTGTIFYWVVEGWSLLDAVYFSVVTLATVGYGDFSPKTAPGKLFTMVYIVVGIGLLAAFANAFAKRWVDRRIRRMTAPPKAPPDTNGQPARRRLRRGR
jgi:hypothetical protein